MFKVKKSYYGDGTSYKVWYTPAWVLAGEERKEPKEVCKFTGSLADCAAWIQLSRMGIEVIQTA